MNTAYDKTETPISTLMCLIGSSVLPYETSFTINLPPYIVTAHYAAHDEVHLLISHSNKQLIDTHLSCTAAANLVRGLAEVSRRGSRQRKRRGGDD